MSNIVWPQPRMLGYTRKHNGADLIAIMKREHEVLPAFANQDAVRTDLPLDRPSNALQCAQNASCLGGGPSAHAANKPLVSSGRGSPFSMRSAMTRSASAIT